MLTEYGFTYGPAEVTRLQYDDVYGVTIEIKGQRGAVIVRVTPSGDVKLESQTQMKGARPMEETTDWRDLLVRYMAAVFAKDHIVGEECVRRAACNADLENDPVALANLGAVCADVLQMDPSLLPWTSDEGLAKAGLTPETIAALRALPDQRD